MRRASAQGARYHAPRSVPRSRPYSQLRPRSAAPAISRYPGSVLQRHCASKAEGVTLRGQRLTPILPPALPFSVPAACILLQSLVPSRRFHTTRTIQYSSTPESESLDQTVADGKVVVPSRPHQLTAVGRTSQGKYWPGDSKS